MGNDSVTLRGEPSRSALQGDLECWQHFGMFGDGAKNPKEPDEAITALAACEADFYPLVNKGHSPHPCHHGPRWKTSDIHTPSPVDVIQLCHYPVPARLQKSSLAQNKVTRVMCEEARRLFLRMRAVPGSPYGSPSRKEKILSKFDQVRGILQNSLAHILHTFHVSRKSIFARRPLTRTSQKC